jgi:hypothetical protein
MVECDLDAEAVSREIGTICDHTVERAAVLASQLPGDMVMVRRGVAARAVMLLWKRGCINAADRLASDLGCTEAPGIQKMIDEADGLNLKKALGGE